MSHLLATRREMSRRSLKHFFKYSWDVLEENTPLDWGWVLEAICDHVQAMLDDWIAVQVAGKAGLTRPEQRIRNLCLNVPPGTAKSRIMMVAAPAWMWMKYPSWRVICLSGNPRVATRDSVYCRKLIDSDWYKEWFDPQWALTGDQNTKTLFNNSVGGFRSALGFGAKLIGDRGDGVFVDDPNDPDGEESTAGRESVNESWDLGIGNRVNDMRTSCRGLIMQRLYENDLTGHALQQMKWEHVVVPMEFDPSKAKTSAIGWNDPRTYTGELMWPERFTPEVLEAEKKRLGSYGFAGQYNQSPSPAGGSIFKKEWFGYYRTLPPLKAVWTTWDTALKAGQKNDETSCDTVGEGEDGNIYVLRMWHGREETPDLGRRLVNQANEMRKTFGDRYRGDYIEDKVSGTTLMQYLRRTHSVLAIIPIKIGPGEDKEVRARGISPYCEAGRVLLPDPSIYPATTMWVRDLLDALAMFPKGEHDDIVDAFVYAVRRLIGKLKTKRNAPATARSGGYV